MRTTFILFLAGIVFSGEPQVGGKNQEYPKEIIKKAITAHGGRENLAKFLRFRFKVKGMVFEGNQKVSADSEHWFHLPHKMKASVTFEQMGNKLTQLKVFNGSKGWSKKGNQVTEMDSSLTKQVRQFLFETWALKLFPLLEDPQVELSYLGEFRENDSVLLGVKVFAREKMDCSFYFDKKSGLMVKNEGVQPGPLGGIIKVKTEYSQFKAFNGALFPTKAVVFLEGKKTFENEIIEIHPLEKEDLSLFQKP